MPARDRASPKRRRPASLPRRRVVAGGAPRRRAPDGSDRRPGGAARRARPPERVAPLPALGRRRLGGRRRLARARRGGRRVPARQLVLHATALHLHDRGDGEPPRARRLSRRGGDRERLRLARGPARRRGTARTGGGRGSGPARRVVVGRRRARSIRRAFALDGVTLWHRDGDGWLEDAGAGAPAGRGRAARSESTHTTNSRWPVGPSQQTSGASSTPTSPSWRRSVKLEELEAEASEAGELERGERPSARDPLGGLARPSHASRRGSRRPSGLAPGREVEWSSDDRSAFLEDDRRGSRPSRRADRQPARHEPPPVGRPPGRAPLRSAWTRSYPRRSAASAHGPEEIEVDVSETLPRVVADPGLLERAVANVVENALAHGGGGGVRLDCRRRRRRRRPARRRSRPRCVARASRPDVRAVPAARRQPARRRGRPRARRCPRVRRGDGRRGRGRGHPGRRAHAASLRLKAAA